MPTSSHETTSKLSGLICDGTYPQTPLTSSPRAPPPPKLSGHIHDAPYPKTPQPPHINLPSELSRHICDATLHAVRTHSRCHLPIDPLTSTSIPTPLHRQDVSMMPPTHIPPEPPQLNSPARLSRRICNTPQPPYLSPPSKPSGRIHYVTYPPTPPHLYPPTKLSGYILDAILQAGGTYS